MMFLQDTPEGTEETAEPAGSIVPTDVDEALDLLEKAKTWLVDEGPGLAVQLVTALAIFVVGRWVAKAIAGTLKRVLKARAVDETLVGFLGSVVYMLLLAFVVIAALGHAGIDTTGLAAIIAAASFAIGFALQGSLGNFAAGVMLMIFRPIKKGDFIEGGGTVGVVEEIGVFATIMKTGDNKKIIVPNAAITGGNIVNYSANPTRRIDFVFGIGYDDDIDKAKEILAKICKEDERVLDDPETTIAVAELADSSVNIVCRPWVNSGDYWPTHFDITERAKKEFDAAGISIPYPQQDVHMHQVA